ncbi:SRPBCC domain-containing protein [Mucilaginibacter sp.]|uniref:SRPBCC family protein n=1 Tax=Mucilaginibacter sp. TaxID=1882438 RepID=UPI0035BC32FA
MEQSTFKIDISATPQKVWNTLFTDEDYKRWTEVFCEGSHAITDWKEGSKAHFLDDKGRGMFAVLEKVVPNEYMSIKALGEIIDGQETYDSDGAKACSGSYENYTLTANGDKTLLTVDLAGGSIPEEFQKFLATVWPKAMIKIKEIAEEE